MTDFQAMKDMFVRADIWADINENRHTITLWAGDERIVFQFNKDGLLIDKSYIC